MAITGVVDQDVIDIAQKYALSRKEVASLLGSYSFRPITVGTADHGGGSHRLDLTLTRCHGMLTIDWGDGKTTQEHGDSAGALTTNHTYAGAGTYIVRVTGYGFTKAAAGQVIA